MPGRSRRAIVAAALIVVVGLAVGAWLVGSRVQSSSQAAARAQPPSPSLLTALVELRVLAATVITRADVVPAASVAVSGPTLDAQGGSGSGIVTGVFVARGDEVVAAARVVEVAGRPVFVFAGSTPAFRAMRPGIAGGDVVQLQAGLVAGGCDAGSSGAYDDATKACVDQLYTGAGYTVVRNSETEVTDLAAARTVVADAEDALALAENVLRQATEPPEPSGLSAAQAVVNDAQRAYDTAVANEPQLVDAATRDSVNAVASAADAMRAATDALSSISATPDTNPGGVSAAQAAVNDARRAYNTAVANQPVLIDRATRDAANAVASARDALTAANDSLADLQTNPETSAQQLAVDQQQQALERAQQTLSELDAISGAIVPFGEITFVPQLPARVDSVNAVVGNPVSGDSGTGSGGSGPLVVLSSPALEARVSIPQANRALVQDGTTVELLYEATGETVTGTVRSIGDELETGATSGVPAYPAVIDAALPESWSGLNVRATFTAASTEHEVLVVPSAAVSSAADGQTRVQVERTDGVVDTVSVTTGLSADGFVEITSNDPAQLHPGDRVVIGR